MVKIFTEKYLDIEGYILCANYFNSCILHMLLSEPFPFPSRMTQNVIIPFQAESGDAPAKEAPSKK